MKLSKNSKSKIQAFFNKKFEEYNKLTLDELKTIYNTKKMSHTERLAIEQATGYLMYQERLKLQEETINQSPNEGSRTMDQGSNVDSTTVNNTIGNGITNII